VQEHVRFELLPAGEREQRARQRGGAETVRGVPSLFHQHDRLMSISISCCMWCLPIRLRALQTLILSARVLTTTLGYILQVLITLITLIITRTRVYIM
jgi:hypothetical protein